jgi:Xaa-Pro dipeptidase
MAKSSVLIQPAEYQQRMAELQNQVRRHDLDVFVVTGEESILYLSGIPFMPLERPFFIFVWADREPELLVPMLERDQLGKAYSVRNVSTYWDYPAAEGRDWQGRLRETVGAAKRIGIEPTCPATVAGVLDPGTLELLPLVEDLRLVKSPAEIQLLRHAARYADQCVDRVLAAAYNGVTLLELFGESRAVQLTMLKEVGYNAYVSSILAGAWPAPASAMPHAIPQLGARYRAGPHIAAAMVRVHGYAAESERTFFVVQPDATLTDAFAAMREARRRAFALARPGAVCAEIDAAANGFLIGEGYADNLRHRCGHGFGLSVHEGPWVSEGSPTILQAGMLISIEPGIYIPDVGGVRHSDTVLITEDGHEPLTRYPDNLEAMLVRGAKPLRRLRGAITRQVAGLG